MQQARTAVIADDDKETLRDLVKILESENFQVSLALDTDHAIHLIDKHHPLLIISEVDNSNYDGISLFKYLDNVTKEKRIDQRVIALTHNKEEQNEILSYDFGIDFYLRKPLRKTAFKKRLTRFFKTEEKPYFQEPLLDYQIRDLFFDVKNQQLLRMPEESFLQIQLKSFEILLFLARYPNQVFSRQEIMQNIWGKGSKVTLRSVDIHILKIRQLLGEGYIQTIKGVGYLFRDKN